MLSSLLLLPAMALAAVAYPQHARRDDPYLPSANAGATGKNATYDYVIIGGGTAGLAMAYRLAQSGCYQVAVIEAGDFYEEVNGNVSVVPAYELQDGQVTADSVNYSPQVDWQFLTTPQTGLQNQQFHYPRGKTLGGSSALNYLCYNRATTQSMDLWAKNVQDPSYTFQNLLPFYRNSVTYTPPNTAVRDQNASVIPPNPSAYQSPGGPVQVSYANWALPWSSWARLGMIEAGIKENQDQVSGQLIGATHFITLIDPKTQTRSSSEAGYLQTAFKSGKTNLKVYKNTLAQKILFDSNKNANGVLVNSSNTLFTLSAKREVILSAGAFQSPQLLMVSGIGPQATLQQFDIPVLSNLAGVGQNMWDHVLYPVLYEVNSETLSSTLTDPQLNQAAIDLYNSKQQGILTSNQADYVGWEKIPSNLRANFSASTASKLQQFPDDWPELEIISNDFGPNAGTPEPGNYATLTTPLVAPLSRGNVTIQSANAAVHPLINPNWLTDEADVEQAIAAILRMREIFNTSAIQGGKIGGELYPGPTVSTYDEIRQHVTTNAATVYHAACTCKMGVSSDPMAVVDNQARVFGVHNLRVVDASAFALLPPGHPTSTVYALAEKIAFDVLAAANGTC